MSAPLPIVKGFRFYSKGSLKGFFDCQLPSGMIATGASCMRRTAVFGSDCRRGAM